MTRLPARGGSLQQVALRIPTRDEISSLVGNLPAAMQKPFQFNTGPRTFLTIGAGMVQISRREPGSADVARERAHLRRMREIDAVVQAEFSGLNEPMAFYESLDEVRARLGDLSDAERPTRGKIRGWSPASRTRMKRTLDTLDYSPLFDDGREPAMITLTMPGSGWEELAPNPRAFKELVYRFKQEYRRAWGVSLVGVWKMEFQRRGAPHLHILMTPPAGVARRGVRGTFREWLGPVWARVVAHPDPIERGKHERAGTGVDYVGDQYLDPRRIATYFAKHGMFEAKGYQNDLPQVWLEAIDGGEAGAAFWGRWGLERAQATVELNELQPVGGGDVSGIIGAPDELDMSAVVTPIRSARSPGHGARSARRSRHRPRDTDDERADRPPVRHRCADSDDRAGQADCRHGGRWNDRCSVTFPPGGIALQQRREFEPEVSVHVDRTTTRENADDDQQRRQRGEPPAENGEDD